MLGTSAAGMLLLHSRIAGLSGMIAGLRHVNIHDEEWQKNVAFLGGLVGGSAAAVALGLGHIGVYSAQSLTEFALSGFIMGMGGRIGHGCTRWAARAVLLICITRAVAIAQKHAAALFFLLESH